MRALPTGTVTFLFTDIEGSTRLLHELGADAYAERLAEHRQVLRDAFARHGGVEVDTQGDAFFVAFPTAPGAVAAAAEARDALSIPVRMGLHTGTPLLTGEGYVGTDVHRAARIAAAGHGRQVLVSAATAALVEPDGLRDLGEHRLKDLSAPERIFQLGDGEFPPLKTLFQTNLPVPATPFVGRERELAEIGELLAREDVRLLTLTGAGGSGKTRLALQAAADAADAYPQGVWWVPLAAVRDPEAVAATASRALGGGGPLPETIGDRRLLLLLDNFEQVVAAAPELTHVLERCANADIAVTSRERLQLGGEQVYPVPVLERSDARELFLARARSVRPDFAGNGSIDELCARLDDLPLALELAAARTTVLSPEQLLSRLGRRLDLLKGGRDADVRQQTLRATIEWSHELLEPEEQRLFARLAVFRDGCTLKAAEEICDAELDRLQSLVDKSLVRVRHEGRFWMLETIHEFALERLNASGEEEAVRAAHAAYFFALAESANLSSDAIDLGQRFEVATPELDNLRAAMDWATARGDVEFALRLVVGLESLWVAQNPYEGERRLTELLAAADELPPELEARALRALGGAVYISGDLERGTALHEESLEAFQRLGDELAAAHIVHRLAMPALDAGDFDRARALSDASLAVHRRHGSRAGEAMALGVLATLEQRQGNFAAALELAVETERLAREVGFTWWQVHYLYFACEMCLELGRPDEAASFGRQGLALADGIGNRQMVLYLLALLAATAAAEGDSERAGCLWGALEREEERGPVGQWEGERDDYGARVRPDDPETFERGRVRGRALGLADAVAYAVSLD